MTDKSIQLIGISGSLRARSYSTALINEIGVLVADRAAWTVFSLSQVPLYNQDLEPTHGEAPQAVIDLRNASTLLV
jgi:chromate reductase, NAD(P)H dehydrogenase (quinone)